MADVRIKSIMTLIFTQNGEIVLSKKEDGTYDTLPLCILGYRGPKYCYVADDTNLIMLTEAEEYKEVAVSFLAQQTGDYAMRTLMDGVYKPDTNSIVDCDRVALDMQIDQMANMNKTSFGIVDEISLPAKSETQGSRLINEVQVRYMVIGKEINLEDSLNVEIIPVDEIVSFVKGNRKQISQRALWFLLGRQLEQVQVFSQKLSKYNKDLPGPIFN